MNRPTLASVLFTTLLQSGYLQAPANAGSPAPDPLLAEARVVRLSVSTGDLGYEPIPDLDERALGEKMNRLCEEALQKAGLTNLPSASTSLTVTLDHAWAGTQRESVALLVTVELRIPAVPEAFSKGQGNDDRRRSLAIWEEQTLELVGSHQVERTVLEALEAALADFVEDREAAAQRALTVPKGLPCSERARSDQERSVRSDSLRVTEGRPLRGALASEAEGARAGLGRACALERARFRPGFLTDACV